MAHNCSINNVRDILFINLSYSPFMYQTTESAIKQYMENNIPSEYLSPYSFRPLAVSDKPTVKSLFIECFPLNYPDTLYADLVSGRYYSIAALDCGEIVGMIVAEIRDYSRLDREDYGFLNRTHYYDNTLYILNLCVTTNHRNKGVATILFQKLYNEFTSQCYSKCRAIYLHVITNNCPAIAFYEKFNFSRFVRIRDFYTVNNRPQDGYLYVLYINDGLPPGPNDKSCMRTAFSCFALTLCTICIVYFLQHLLTSHAVT